MNIGRKRHRFRIDELSASTADGQTTETWLPVAVRRGSLRTLSGREIVENDQVEARTQVEIEIRFFAGLTTAHRLCLVDNDVAAAAVGLGTAASDSDVGDVYNIAALDNVEGRNRIHRIHAIRQET